MIGRADAVGNSSLIGEGLQLTLTDAGTTIYRQPYLAPDEARRPTLSWPRQLPLGGEPADVVASVQAYADRLADSDLAKLLKSAGASALADFERCVLGGRTVTW